jgi:hypothetical protein
MFLHNLHFPSLLSIGIYEIKYNIYPPEAQAPYENCTIFSKKRSRRFDFGDRDILLSPYNPLSIIIW